MTRRPIRPILIEGQTAYVPLTQGYTAIIDAADVPLVSGFNWYALVQLRAVYAIRGDYSDGPRKVVWMHRLIMGAPPGMEVDHIDSNGLNNRRSNMRLATKQQNQSNRRISCNNKSGFKGVCWETSKRRWRADINSGGKKKYLGYFDTPEAAYSAYCEASKLIHGEFGRTT